VAAKSVNPKRPIYFVSSGTLRSRVNQSQIASVRVCARYRLYVVRSRLRTYDQAQHSSAAPRHSPTLAGAFRRGGDRIRGTGARVTGAPAVISALIGRAGRRGSGHHGARSAERRNTTPGPHVAGYVIVGRICLISPPKDTHAPRSPASTWLARARAFAL